MHLEVFAEGHSFLHRLDPRIKLLSYLVFAFFCVLAENLKALSCYAMMAFLLLLLARLNFKELRKRFLLANLFLSLFWLFLLFEEYDPPYLLEVFAFKISLQGMLLALQLALKANALLMITIALLGTSNLLALAHGLLHLRVPVKLVVIFFLCYRYLTVLHEEYTEVKRAVLARGFLPRNNLFTYRTLAYLVAVLLLRSWERAEEIYRAMLARGFRGYFPLLHHFTLSPKDMGFFLFFVVLILGTFYIK